MEAVKRNVCRGVIFLMACLTCVVVFGSGLIAEAAGANTPYAGGTSYTALIFEKVWEDGEDTSSRPEKITFTVDLEDHNGGKSQAKKIEDVEITLTKEGNWTYTYVDNKGKGENYGYYYNSLKELEVDGYEYVGEKVKIDQNTVTVTLTNRKKNDLTVTAAELGINGTKTLVGRDFRSGEIFTFKIEPQKEAPAPVGSDGKSLTQVTITPGSGSKAEIKFDGTFTFTAPGTYAYQISEVKPENPVDGMSYDPTVYQLTVEVKETQAAGAGSDQDSQTDGEGDDQTQTAGEKQGELAITNVKIEKSINGSDDWEVVDPEDGSLSWTNTWKEPDDPGDGPGDDPGDGPGDDPSPSYTSLTVNKAWILDDGGEAPVSVTVELLRNNRVYKEVTLDEDNDWSHTWTGLEDHYNWRVREADVPDGFTAEVSHRGTIWTITNDDIPEDPETPPEEPDEPDEPDTPEDPVTPDEPDVPDTPDTPDEPNTPNEPTLPQTGQNWRLVWILAITGAVLVLVGILGKKGYHGKHEA